MLAGKALKRLEARVGIEPTHKGFADLSLTTWVPRLASITLAFADGIVQITLSCTTESPATNVEICGGKSWSGRRGSNPRHRPWQGRALPLSYSRLTEFHYKQGS